MSFETFYEIKRNAFNKFDIYLDELDADNNVAEAAMIQSMEKYINDSAGECFLANPEWAKKYDNIVTTASHDDGTVTATNGSGAIVGSSANLTREMVGQKMVITDDTDGNFVTRIKTYADADNITINPQYTYTGGAGLSYTIYFDTYKLPPDFKTFSKGKYIKPARSYRTYKTYLLSSSSGSSGMRVILIGRTTEPYYDMGNVTITKGSTTATVGGGGTVDSTWVGKVAQMGNYSRTYEITDVDTVANTFDIDKGYGGDDVSTDNYAIDPPGIQQLQFLTAPDSAVIKPYEYYPYAPRMQEDNDVSIIPSDSVLLLGGIAKYAAHEDDPQWPQFTQLFEQEKRRINNTQIDRRQKKLKFRRGSWK